MKIGQPTEVVPGTFLWFGDKYVRVGLEAVPRGYIFPFGQTWTAVVSLFYPSVRRIAMINDNHCIDSVLPQLVHFNCSQVHASAAGCTYQQFGK